MSRQQLAKIPSLTFYKDELTNSRRTAPISQLTCVGKPCKLYTPDVVRCTNLGGTGTDVDWKCEADLPESLRFGRVEVSCEGWTSPGDSFVLKGSCGLEYRLVHVPGSLRNPESQSSMRDWFRSLDVSEIVFSILWTAVLALITYSFLKSCFGQPTITNRRPQNHGPSGWFPGSYGDDYAPPPPYTKSPADQGWRPGFWTGAALGGLGAHFFNNRRPRNEEPPPRPTRRFWDWENSRASSILGRRGANYEFENRGEGPSNLGTMRSSTGFGGSNVR
ncbi:DUF1183-domain-containing protein [Guyanagaster necrorhizus]|uniref:Store-operated calcium entry-associated regulatory factor n=1 Tax=Guyanagaster necrorhizus TaxID=856835 RepID=A0A9P8AXG8_9AGAR|nr:DUF1183-domain-containing protein [Guyanagaster necrorhizus MCA 3950]KAG7451206.1 DUF1183-domain-containing protein [Guyanagaster necrorhizus MCA 3950]